MDDNGARALIASILKQAYTDYTSSDTCPEWCQFKGGCDNKKEPDKEYCIAKSFIRSAWCATMAEQIGIDHNAYVATCIKNNRLSRNTYQYVKRLICEHNDTIKRLDAMKRNMILSTGEAQEIRGTDVGDRTANTAIKISLDRQMAETEKQIKAVKRVHNSLTSERKAVMENFWLNRYTNTGLAEKLNCGERSIKRWKQQIVYSVAYELKFL